ncbi:MAG: rhamnulokinase [Phycisphaerales bacterium]|nr:rhamnulokinase [Phycisphaerales bacterium]
MPSTHEYLAIDLGASSGRGVLGSFDGERLTLREVHRFLNGPLERPTGLYWDAPRLLEEIKQSLTLCGHAKAALAGIAIDTWGVDYGLLDSRDNLLGLPHHYRDPRTHDMMQEALTHIPREHIYARTGIQFMPLNTLYQLLADLQSHDNPLDRASRLLFMPDILNFWLTGIKRTEQTIASTSQFYDTASNTWATDITDAFGIPSRILPTISAPGTTIGPLTEALARDTGAGPIPVLAVGSHDTASAVAAVPAISASADWAYISSGTWSLVGRELTAPLRTAEALAANFTNETGIAGTIRFHKNIAGLWLLQECQRVWAAQGKAYTFDHLMRLAHQAPPLAASIDLDHPPFSEFGDMPQKIGEYCTRTRQAPPSSDGAIVRCILESLALKSRLVIDALESLTGPVRTIHIVGGGAQNALLCQFTADAAARPVLAGPVEATAAGNIMTQMLAQGKAGSLADIRRVLAASFQPTRYDPRNASAWTDALGRLRSLVIS